MSHGQAWLEQLSATDFRNLARVEIALPPSGLVLVGENGQGKTNFLEAIYYLQVLRSARGAHDRDLVRFGSEGFHIAAAFQSDARHHMKIGFERTSGRKKVAIDGLVATRMSDAFGSMPVVMFSPRDIQLVSEGPGERRRFLDMMLSLSSRKYLSSLQTYRAALVRRNAALRDAARRGDLSAVAVWEPPLAESGAVLVRERLSWIAGNRDAFARLCGHIGEVGEPSLSYRSALVRSENLEADLAESLAQHRTRDTVRGVTHSGPHRDELSITLGARDLRMFGSAGQQRTAAIALRMLESATLRAARGFSPVLLLDDPFAELDLRRSAKILELLERSGFGQTVLAVPRDADIPPELLGLERARVTDGRVEIAA